MYPLFALTSIEGLTATCTAALGLPNLISRTYIVCKHNTPHNHKIIKTQ